MDSLKEAARCGLYRPEMEHDACGLGFVVNLDGRRSYTIVKQAVEVLNKLHHRGACGCEEDTGDGAGIILQMPDRFFRDFRTRLSFSLPEPGSYGAGIVFLPTDPEARYQCEWTFEKIIREEGQRVLGWRTVPTNSSGLGLSSKATEPVMRQVFIGRNPDLADAMDFERKLYVIRRRVEKAVAAWDHPQNGMFYVCSLSHRTLVYKGMLKSDQLLPFFLDLQNSTMETAMAMVHSRFSTNTFPSWARAHPYRYLAHNGEINTLRGNINWMKARESMFRSTLFGEDLRKILPVLDEEGSDSGIFDNALELLHLAGRSLPHAMMMMIPEPWSGHEGMERARKDFYRFHSCLMEPWDGPACVAFTDGRLIGTVLDRNGLRPSRYYVTDEGQVVMASEVGVLDIAAQSVVEKGRLLPGRMLLVDTDQGRIIPDDELKDRIAAEQPYGEWVRRNQVSLSQLPEPEAAPAADPAELLVQQKLFGYTNEDVHVLIRPMAETAAEPIGSMGNDASLAVLSERPQLLFDYFKQLFAQVTNPPIDAIREEIVTSAQTTIGPESNLLEPDPESARQIQLESAVISNEDLEKLRRLDGSHIGADRIPGFRSITLPMLFPAEGGGDALEKALEELRRSAGRAIREGYEVIILSDREAGRELAPIPSLLALAGVHHHLIREKSRTRVGLVVESGEPREIHHFALLIGYGASAINPYLVFESIRDLVERGHLEGLTYRDAVRHYLKAAAKGVVKVMSKMGISTVQSYHGAQIFEAIGLDSKVIDRYFTGTVSRLAGIDLDIIAREARLRHLEAFRTPVSTPGLEEGGKYRWRKSGEFHQFRPEVVHLLRRACRTDDWEAYKRYSRLVNDPSRNTAVLRSLLEFDSDRPPVPLEEVEPVESIVRRFKSGAMSYGSISKEAHEALAVAMNRLGARSNTGEGGEDPERYQDPPGGDSRNSAVKQVASGRFGVTSEYLVNAREIQIKMAQGAKPGEGGQLPGHKVYPEIARVRYSTPGVGLISPPPHHDIYSIEDLAQLIHDLKNANSEALISVKLVAEVGVGTVAAGVAKAHADVILISGHDGGTGASPLTGIKHAGVPWELGLAETQQVLVLNDLRGRVRLEVDGQLKTGRDVVVGALLGAEEFGFGTLPLMALGCIMMRVCHLNTCPVGVATQDPRLRKRFDGDPAYIVNLMLMIAREVREIMAQLGFRTFDEMVGRTDCLKFKPREEHWKAKNLDLSPILFRPRVPEYVGKKSTTEQDHGLERSLDVRKLLRICKPALENGYPITVSLPIHNTDRVVGTLLGSEVTRRYGSRGLPPGTIDLRFKGSAGQSFGAFLPPGITLILEGDANDYLGKGLSGGRIVLFPPKSSRFNPEENVITGNVAFYGATRGEAFLSGIAGERFCVRNSGVTAVVEGVGDHGCEYMTGGRVVILGSTGRNFAAGMSGGIAYVFDHEGKLDERSNLEMVGLYPFEEMDPEEEQLVRRLIQEHINLTGSQMGWKIISNWDQEKKKIVKVFPHDYRRVLEAEKNGGSDSADAESLMTAVRN